MNQPSIQSHRTAAMLCCIMLMMLVGMMLAGCNLIKHKKDALRDPLTPSAFPQIAALEGIGRWLTFSSPAISTQGNGQVSILIPVTAGDAYEQIEAQYKFEFFDAKGRPYLQQEDWRFIRLPARTTRHLETTSPHGDSRNWRLLIRPAGVGTKP